MSEEQKTWYILKQADGHCQISQIQAGEGSAPGEAEAEKAPDQWGPFASEAEALAHRVGLIRSGKCLPV